MNKIRLVLLIAILISVVNCLTFIQLQNVKDLTFEQDKMTEGKRLFLKMKFTF